MSMPYAKRSKGYRRPRSMIQRVLKNMAENKREAFHVNQQTMNHDAGSGLVVGAFGRPQNKSGYNWLGVDQGGDTKCTREGDNIYSQYVDYKIQLMGYSNYPSQACRIIIFSPKIGSASGADFNLVGSTSVASLFVTDGSVTGSGNLLIQPVDTFKFKVLRDFVVHPLKNQIQGATANGNGLLYDLMHPSIPDGPFISNAGYYRELFTEYNSLLNSFIAAGSVCVEHPEIAAAAEHFNVRRGLKTDQYIDAVDRYDEIQEELTLEPVDDAGNDCNYPIVSGRIKTNRRVQYQTGSALPLKSTDYIQVAIIPYADHSAGTGDEILKYNQEIVHYFKDF